MGGGRRDQGAVGAGPGEEATGVAGLGSKPNPLKARLAVLRGNRGLDGVLRGLRGSFRQGCPKLCSIKTPVPKSLERSCVCVFGGGGRGVWVCVWVSELGMWKRVLLPFLRRESWSQGKHMSFAVTALRVSSGPLSSTESDMS